MCFPGAGSGIHYINGPRITEKWMAAPLHPRRLPSQKGGKNGRAKLLREVPVQFIQISQADGLVARFIGAVTAPGIQPDRHSDRPDEPATVRTSDNSARTACSGASEKTAVPSCSGHQGRACMGTSALRSMHRLC